MAPPDRHPRRLRLATPTAIVADAAGNWFVADATHGTVTRFGADGSVNTDYVTGLDTPTALYLDRFGNLYIAQAGAPTTSSRSTPPAHAASSPAAAATPAPTASPQPPPASSHPAPSPWTSTASSTSPTSAVIASTPSISSGIIHIVAGNGGTTTTLPGQATGTALIAPVSLAADAAGDLYIADQGASIIYVVYAAATSGNNIASCSMAPAQRVLPSPPTARSHRTRRQRQSLRRQRNH